MSEPISDDVPIRISVYRNGRWSWHAKVEVLTSLFGQPGERAIFMTWRTFTAMTEARVKAKAQRYADSLRATEVISA